MKEPKVTKPLHLLDDSITYISHEEREWLELTKSSLIKKEATKPEKTQPSVQQLLYQQLKTAKPSNNLTTTPKGTKVFKNQKTLRQLMGEYNGRKNTLAPLKSTISQSQISKPVSKNEFKYDRMEIMEVPTINGKILRPQNPNKNIKK